MQLTSIRATALVGLLGVTALIAAPLSAAGAETPTLVVTPQAVSKHLGNDTRTVPAAEERAEKLGLGVQSSAIKTLAASTGVHRIYVSIVDVTTSTADNTNPNLTVAGVTSAVQAINAYWQEESAGKVSFELGGVETRSLNKTACDPDAVWNSQQSVAFSGQFDNGAWVGTSKHLLTLTLEKAACEQGAGFGTVGLDGGLIFSASGIDSTTGLPVLYHEYGHNLGLSHANAAICRSSSIDASVGNYVFVNVAADAGGVYQTSVKCPVEEYGDVLDIMGYTVDNSAPHASSPERYAFGWMTATKPVAAKTTTVTLRSLNESTGTRAIRVTDPRSGAVYFVEYRTPAGRDANSIEFQNTQAGTYYPAAIYTGNYAVAFASGDAANGIVRILRPLKLESGSPAGSTVLAVAPVSTDGRTRLDSLGAGESFTTAGGGTKISVTSLSPAGGAVIKVTTQKSASTTSIKPAKSSIKKKTTSKLAITVKAVTTSKPAGKVTVYSKGKVVKTYTLSSTKSGKITVTLPKFSKTGSYSLKVKYSGSSAVASSTSKTVTLKVK